MNIERYIIVQAVKSKNNELIPVWDERVLFEKTSNCGNVITLKGDYREHFQLTECIFDLKTKRIETGIEISYYTPESDLAFKKDTIVLFEKSDRKLIEAKIVDILYEEYELDIKRGRKIDKWWVDKFQVEIEGDTLYAIKHWKPIYLLDTGDKVEWDHQLFHKGYE